MFWTEKASNTPPSLGGRSLRSIGAIMAYDQNLFIYNDKASGSQWMAVKMQPLPSAHVSVDLKGDLTAMDGKWEDVFHASTTVVHADDEGPHFWKAICHDDVNTADSVSHPTVLGPEDFSFASTYP